MPTIVLTSLTQRGTVKDFFACVSGYVASGIPIALLAGHEYLPFRKTRLRASQISQPD
jgi:hypothetical protein